MAQKWVWEEDLGELVLSGPRKGFRQKYYVQTKPPPLLSVQDRAQPESKVTLEDIKAVAISLVSEKSVLSVTKSVSKLFDQCFRTDQMNTFLWSSLLYYDAILRHREASGNENLSISGMVGENAREALRKMEKELDQTRANLGQVYSQFILGVENWNFHHSKGGRSRVSKTQTDQMLFEILYEFVMLCVWICFSYENWEIIHTQLGKFFRTSAFNRECNEACADKCLMVEGLGSISKKSDEYLSYRVHYDRPPAGSLKCLRSPAIVNFLPHSNQLPSFRRKSKDDLSSFQKKSESKQLGIIGDRLSRYDQQNLRLLQTSQDRASDRDSDDEELCDDNMDI